MTAEVERTGEGLREGPLSGVRVLDLTHIIVGPYCTKLLGDMGAEIIKVESPSGDGARDFGVRRNPGMGANFMIFNRNKRSIALDLKSEAGYDVLCRLARHSGHVWAAQRPTDASPIAPRDCRTNQRFVRGC